MTARQMLLTEITLNPSVKEKDELRLSRQALEIYNLLKLGPVTTQQAASIACQYNARINEIRHALKFFGLMVDKIEGRDGGNIYQIVTLEKSTFWKEIKQKGEQWKW